MSFKKLLKMVDDGSKDSVFGYIRQSCKESGKASIPMMIQYCCLRYYFLNEYFSKCGINMKISDNGHVVRAIRRSEHVDSAIGKFIVDLRNDLVTEYKWTIKLLKLTAGGRFGLVSENYCKFHYVCGLGFSSGTIIGHSCVIPEAYGKGCVKNDIISMVLNVKSQTLSYHHNGRNLGDIAVKIDKKTNYKMAVTLYQTDSVVQLVRYQEKYD